MSATQANRNLAIDTPLGEDRVLIASATVTEELGRLFQIEVELYSEEPDLLFENIVGDNATIRLTLPQSATPRYFNGFVSRFVQTNTNQTGERYRAMLVPWLWFLTRTADCRIFQNETVPDIIKAVFRDLGFTDFEDRLSGNYASKEYCVQYRETDFNFVSRLMEQEGIYYFFEHGNGKHTLILADGVSAHNPYPGYDTIPFDAHRHASQHVREGIQSLTLAQEVQPGAYVLNDFNFENPRTSLAAQSNIASAHAQSTYEVYDYPGRYTEQGEGDEYSKVRIEELHTQHEILSGQSNARGIATGYIFTLDDAPRPDQNRRYLVTGASYYLTGDDYQSSGRGSKDIDFYACTFRSIDADKPFRTGRLTPKPRIQGPQTAMVVGPKGEEIYTDEYGRIKVQFHWDRYGKADENSSCWVRVSQAAWAGKKWGALHIPRVGHEVIVEFLEGDPDLPIVTGQVYNAGAMPPYDLPAHKTRTTLKSRSSKGGGGFNELRFEDKKGSEQVFIHAERNYDLRVKGNSMEAVGGEKHLIVEDSQFQKIKGDQHQDIDGEHNQKVGETFSLSTGQDVQLKAGRNIGAEAASEIHLQAGTIVISADHMVTIKSGGSFVTITPSGVYINGKPVVINNGGLVGIGMGIAPTSPQAAKAADDAMGGEATDVNNAPPGTSQLPLDATPIMGPAATALKNAATYGLPVCEVCEAARKPPSGQPSPPPPPPDEKENPDADLDGRDDVDPEETDNPDAELEGSDDVDPEVAQGHFNRAGHQPGEDDDGGDFSDDVDPPGGSEATGPSPGMPPGESNTPRYSDNNTPPPATPEPPEPPPPVSETPPPAPGEDFHGGGGESGGGGSNEGW